MADEDRPRVTNDRQDQPCNEDFEEEEPTAASDAALGELGTAFRELCIDGLTYLIPKKHLDLPALQMLGVAVKRTKGPGRYYDEYVTGTRMIGLDKKERAVYITWDGHVIEASIPNNVKLAALPRGFDKITMRCHVDDGREFTWDEGADVSTRGMLRALHELKATRSSTTGAGSGKLKLRFTYPVACFELKDGDGGAQFPVAVSVVAGATITVTCEVTSGEAHRTHSLQAAAGAAGIQWHATGTDDGPICLSMKRDSTTTIDLQDYEVHGKPLTVVAAEIFEKGKAACRHPQSWTHLALTPSDPADWDLPESPFAVDQVEDFEGRSESFLKLLEGLVLTVREQRRLEEPLKKLLRKLEKLQEVELREG